MRRTLRGWLRPWAEHHSPDGAATDWVDPAARERDMAMRFRHSHARLGVLLSLATTVEVAGYAWLGHPVADRGTILALSLASAVGTCLLWVIAPVMARARHSETYFFVWSAAVIAIILLGTALDGGEKSPIAILLFLPMLYAALAYRPPVVMVLGIAEVLGYIVVSDTDATPNTAFATLVAATLFLTVLMAALSARNRERQARELHALAVRLESEATRDGLTGCLNRRGFDVAIEEEVSRAVRYGRPLSLLLIDVDHLKSINDERGHAGGDLALQQVAAALSRAGRRNDVAARLGGDEFVLLTPETEIADALELAGRMHAALEAATAPAFVRVSIGVAALSHEATTADAVLLAADNALYAAKKAGRGRTVSVDNSPRAEFACERHEFDSC